MKVLLFLPFPPDSPTGNAVTARRIARSLESAGIEVVLAEVRRDSAAAELVTLIDRHRPDVLHWYHAWKTGRHLPQVRGARALPSVVTLTGTDVNHDAEDSSRRGGVLQALELADAIVSYSPALAERAVALVPSVAGKVSVIPKGVDLGTAAWTPPEFLRGESVLFFQPAGVRPEKNNRAAVRALDAAHAADPRVRLLLAGPILDPTYAEGLRAELASRPWAGHVERIPHEQMASAYAASAVVLNTSLSEGLSNAVIEAIACGRAVLASDIPGNRQIVEHEVTGILYRDEADLAVQARRLAADPALRARLGAEAKKRAAERFSTDREAAAMFRVLAAVRLRFDGDGRQGQVGSLDAWKGVLASRWRLLLGASSDPEPRLSGSVPCLSEARSGTLGSDHATELTARVLLADAERLRGRVVWEVGCGSGVLACLCAREGAREVWGTDVDGEAIALAQATASASGVQVRTRRADLMEADIRADVVIANLPQKPVPPGVPFPLANDGGPDGARLLLRLVEQAESRLVPGGRLYLFLHSLTSPEVLDRLLRGFEVSLRAVSTRRFEATEFAAVLPYWRELRATGRCFFAEGQDGQGEFWCAVVSCVRR